jgi:2-methylcitrate dehydratase PrpD
MQFAMAAALHARRVGLLEVSDEFVRSEAMQSAMKIVQVETQDEDDPRRPGEAPIEIVEVVTRDGRQLRKEVEHARGTAAYPLREGELFTKFEGCLAYGGLRAPARQLFDALMHIDKAPGTAELYRLG